jgi:hypothetical protein
MPPTVHTGRFRANDPDVLVRASLACPFCLGSDEIVWELEAADGYDPSAACQCPHCRHGWRVYVTPTQALRLGFVGK